jgi:hypothetical protein
LRTARGLSVPAAGLEAAIAPAPVNLAEQNLWGVPPPYQNELSY